MIRRVRIEWPDPRPFAGRDGRPIRLLAASDEPDPALSHPATRATVGPIDAVIGCGDLDPSDLGFLADAFCAPLAYVRGNHDRGGSWSAGEAHLPEALPTARVSRVAGLAAVGLPWPSGDRIHARREERGAWRQVLEVAARTAIGPPAGRRREPILVVSHAPPLDIGDVPSDAYHRGFGGYAWLARRLRSPLWLHGHTPVAATRERFVRRGGTAFLNVTGVAIIELIAATAGEAPHPTRR